MHTQFTYTVDRDHVEELRDHILQDYMRLALAKAYGDRDWLDDYRSMLEKVDSERTDASIKEVLNTLRSKGEGYSIGDMDVSMINKVLTVADLKKNMKLGWLHPAIRSYLKAITDDRNGLRAHSSSNETQFDLLLNALIMLEHLHRFVLAVWMKDEDSLTKDDRESFRDKWEARVLELRNDVSAQFESFEHNRALDRILKDDIAWAASHRDPEYAFGELSKEYHSRLRGSMDDFQRLHRFHVAASDAGSYFDSLILGETYFKGNGAVSIPRDYRLSGVYYARAMRRLPGDKVFPLEDMTRFASIIMNGLCEGYPKEHGRELLDSVRARMPDTCHIVSYEEDGLTLYKFERKNANHRREESRRATEAWIAQYNAEQERKRGHAGDA